MSEPTPITFDKLLKATEVAKILGISKTSAYRLMQTGEIPSVRIGQSIVRVRPADLQRYIEANLTKELHNFVTEHIGERN